MTELFAFMFVFFVGVIVGFATFIGIGAYQVNKVKKKKEALVEEVKKKAAEYEQKTLSIKERLAKASQLAQSQADLRSQAETPSKNSVHSRYKNGLIAEINELEQQKINILKTILAEGFNPVITVVHESGGKEELALSEYVAAAQNGLDKMTGKKSEDASPQETSEDKPVAPKQVGKFFVYKGGKPDGTVH